MKPFNTILKSREISYQVTVLNRQSGKSKTFTFRATSERTADEMANWIRELITAEEQYFKDMDELSKQCEELIEGSL